MKSYLPLRKTRLTGFGARIGYFAAARHLRNRGLTLEQTLLLLRAGIL